MFMKTFHGRRGHIPALTRAGVDFVVVENRHDGYIFGVSNLRHTEELQGARVVNSVIIRGTRGSVKVELDWDGIGGTFQVLKNLS
jgi:hypothetical protein